MGTHEQHRTRTLWLTGVLHAFTHLYQVALMPLYLLMQKDFNFASVSQATLAADGDDGGLLSRRATPSACWRTG